MNTITTTYIEKLYIRPMTVEDLEQVLVIENLSFSLPWPISAYEYELEQNPLSLLWVAETYSFEGQQQIVGMIVIWMIVDEAHIATLAVHPEHRRKGIASKLLSAALVDSIRRGMRCVTLEVRASNLVAQRLYSGFRFEIVGRRPHYYRDNNEDALIMTASKLDEIYLGWLEQDRWMYLQGDNQ